MFTNIIDHNKSLSIRIRILIRPIHECFYRWGLGNERFNIRKGHSYLRQWFCGVDVNPPNFHGGWHERPSSLHAVMRVDQHQAHVPGNSLKVDLEAGRTKNNVMFPSGVQKCMSRPHGNSSYSVYHPLVEAHAGRKRKEEVRKIRRVVETTKSRECSREEGRRRNSNIWNLIPLHESQETVSVEHFDEQ